MVVALTITEFGTAADSSRAATLTVSPSAMISRRCAPPISPTTTGPVWTPMRTESWSLPVAASLLTATISSAGTYGALGVVVVRDRPTEAEEDAVPAVALDRAPEAVRDLDCTLVVPLDQLAEVLGVHTCRQLCGSDEIAADHRDRTALDVE